MNKYFKTDGIRGIINKDLTVDLLIRIGKACRMFDAYGIFVSTDTRISRDLAFNSISIGLIQSGVDVIDLGILSTPALVYLCEKHNMVGISITASHNSYCYNGVKIINKGNKLSAIEEEKLEELIDSNLDNLDKLGKVIKLNLKEEYINYISLLKTNSNKKICVDMANGAMCEIAKEVFDSNTLFINDKPDGYNINKKCGATCLDNLIKNVKENSCDIGFSYDGDGDRIMAVDNKGNIIDGDMIIYIIIRYYLDLGLLRNNRVALTIMSNIGIINDLNKKGVDVILCDVGDKHILEALNKYDLQIGGESSGHIILKDFLNTGDGLLVSLKLIDILNDIGDFNYYLKDLKIYPKKSFNIEIENKDLIINNDELLERIKHYNDLYGDEIKIILRKSGTECLVRLTIMGYDDEIVDLILNDLMEIISKIRLLI